MPEIASLKTINGNSLEGTGNLVIGGGSFSGTMDDIDNGSTYVKTENNYTDDEVTKLAGIANSATANSSDATLLNTDNHADGSTNKVYSAADKTKLAGITAGAQVNSAITKAEIEAKLTGLIASHTHDYAAPLWADDNYATDAEKVKLSNLSGTNSGDNAVNSNYSGLVSNATHTGDATGSTALTVVKINGTSLAGLATGILKNTTGTGVPSIAVAGDFPTLNQNTTGQSNTVVTNANLTGDVTSVGNATTIKTSVTLVTPVIGVATGTSLVVTGALTSSGGGNGYSTGAGGTQSQGTSRTTTVVLSKLCGNITMFSAAQAAQAIVTFTLTNTFIAATDFILIQHISATNAGAWQFSVVAGSGTCNISIRNVSTGSITEATPLRFTIIKGVTS